MKDDLDDMLERTRTALLGICFAVLGVLLITAGKWLTELDLGPFGWMRAIPFSELGATLFGIGVVGVAYDYYSRRDDEEATVRRLKRTLKEEAPIMRDAVIEGFAFNTVDLKRVATPELLDQLAENSLALRFGDEAFAREVYGEIRDQAIRAPERWLDANVSIDLGLPRDGTGASRPVFSVVVRWEYTVVPRHRFRRFTVVSDRHRYEELAAEGGATSAWFKQPIDGLSVTDTASFELVQFMVDGEQCPIERQADELSQTYIVDLGELVVSKGKPVVVSYIYVTRTAQAGHVLHVDIDRPTRGLSAMITYEGCGIEKMRMFDFVSSGRDARISAEPESTDNRTLRFGYDGWLFPKAGLIFVWTLEWDRRLLGPAHKHTRHTEAT